MKKLEKLEKLKLQLFAASETPGDSDQEEINVDDDVQYDDESEDIEDIEDLEDDEPEESEETDEEIDEENNDEEDNSRLSNEDGEEEKPFMVFKSKDEHQKYMDNVIGNRLKDYRETKEKLEEYDSVLNVIKDYFEVDDFDGLKKKTEDLLEDIAYQKGITKQQLLKQQKEQKELRELRALKEQQQRTMFEQAFNADCAKLSKINPDLYGDIKPDELMQNKQFLQMLRSGVPFKAAYDALHVEELIKKQTAIAKKKAIDNVKASGKRIKENAGKKSKAGNIKIDVNKLTDEQLAELEERAANGEIVRL
jgi:hypothetical protein